MRAAWILLAMTSVATANKTVDDALARNDADALGRLVVSEPGDRERIVAALIRLKRLDARAVSLLPSRAEVQQGLDKLKSTNPLQATSCGLVGSTATELVFVCSERSCGSACRVLRRDMTVKIRRTGYSLGDVITKNLGDTGECGCCT